MTVEELRFEANRLGYRLYKKPEPTQLLPCKCGHELSEIEDLHINRHGKYYQCPACKLYMPKMSSTGNGAKILWNKLIRKGMRK